jgi:hypothetical protein
MRFWLLLILACTACSIEERGAPGTDPDTELELGTENDSLEIKLIAPATARAGDAVPIAIEVRNVTMRTLELSLAGRQIAFDIVVSRENEIVWQRLAGQTVPAILQLKTLPSGESFELHDVWKVNAGPGNYSVVGSIITDAAPLQTDSVTIAIT